MRLKKMYFLLFAILCFQSCDFNETINSEQNISSEEINSKISRSDTLSKAKDSNNRTVAKINRENIDSLESLWKWHEKSSLRPKLSTIKNFQYDEKKLFNKWGRLNTSNNKIEYLFSIDEKKHNWGGRSYYYTIRYDSIWIYTDSDILDGIDRGIINKLTTDSLVISWSTGDCDTYFTIR
jgi:hypothetical protein